MNISLGRRPFDWTQFGSKFAHFQVSDGDGACSLHLAGLGLDSRYVSKVREIRQNADPAMLMTFIFKSSTQNFGETHRFSDLESRSPFRTSRSQSCFFPQSLGLEVLTTWSLEHIIGQWSTIAVGRFDACQPLSTGFFRHCPVTAKVVVAKFQCCSCLSPG